MSGPRVENVPPAVGDRRSRGYGLALLSGIMLGCSFPPLHLGILACFGLVPLLVALNRAARLRDAIKLIYAAMFVFHAITLNWTGGYVHGNDPYMMIAGGITMIVHPLFYFLPLGLFYLIRRRFGLSPGLASLPFLWVGYEYSHSLSEWSFPWLTIGNSQSYDLARIQFISFTGIWGLSFWILLVNVAAYLLYRSLALPPGEILPRRTIGLAALLALIFVLPTVEGTWVLSGAPRAGEWAHGGRHITVGIVQSNVDPWEKWARPEGDLVSLYLGLTNRLIGRMNSPRPQIVLWPETAITGFPLLPRSRRVLDRLRAGVDSMHVAVLTGIDHAVVYSDPSKAPPSARSFSGSEGRYDTFNAAAFIQPGRSDIPWYGKMKMVPIAERIPYADMFAFLDFMRWGVGIGGWQIGPDTTVFTDAESGVKFSSIICYESTYPGFVASFVRKGAEFIALITIDSWWGKMSGAYQHRQFATFRAVENRRWIARCAVGGISCFIDPYGRSFDDTEMFTERVLSRTIGTDDALTFYTRQGDWLGESALLAALMFTAALAGQSFTDRRNRQSWQNTSST
ncbi:MAG TPA: apolipoprotein N-acyltransferase [Bacteroidota bacterium]|nr:apolipoprotein N-acyltransferase [Bacteroidota bacterium]